MLTCYLLFYNKYSTVGQGSGEINHPSSISFSRDFKQLLFVHHPVSILTNYFRRDRKPKRFKDFDASGSFPLW